MGFMDKLKEAADKAKETAENAAQKAKEVYEQKKEEHEEKKLVEEAYDIEMKEKVRVLSKSLIDAIYESGDDSNGGFYTDIVESDILAFTKDFFEKILLPANSASKSYISMYPYIDEKKLKSINKSFPNYDATEIAVIMIKDTDNQEFLLTTRSFYFKVAHPDDGKYFAIGKVSCNKISIFTLEKQEISYTFKCDGFKLADLKITNKYEEDFITLNNYFKCITKKDFEITDQEIDTIIHEKIGDKVYEQVKKYMIYDDELAIYFAWGLDSITAKDYIVCTTKQIIIMNREAFGATANVKQFYYEDITSVATIQNTNNSTLTGMIVDAALTAALKLCDLEINVAGAKEKISTLNKLEAERVVALYHLYRKSIKQENKQPQVIMQQSEAKPDIIDQITQLAKLKDAGILTEEEFDNKKADLLAKL
ncbi:SHOCT domain-containing protein [[Clostridium] fimetarium]|uniref:Short C-terminal domain-containing protein n=1 Tax=[Clostridium] fimetarium TaxID=99656 RepID=A0A1I0MZ07_9FIRM|nr:SHOCT domain-containing protein [[Clostridium] fimetarium]SEV93755.1 Short C-terminal domain-containing protein [[Clostridium] fimetarium]